MARSRGESNRAAPFRRSDRTRYLRPVHCSRLVLVGDAHLGRESREIEQAFLAFLETVPELGDGLCITGDLFEFFFAYGRAIPREGLRVVAALATLGRRMPIFLAGGNHDRWASHFWAEDLALEFAPGEGRFELAGQPAAVVHGDGITEGHWSGRLLHRITRHDLTVGLFRALHPDLGIWLVDRLSGVLGDRSRTDAEIQAVATHQAGWARQRLEREPTLVLLAMGHTHRAAAVEVAPGRWYVNPGAWFDGYRYATVADGRATLAQFTP